MWTEQQGKKATHDFLSLYTKDSSFQLQDPRPPPPATPSKGGLYQLKTYDFLQPLERRGGDDGCDKNRPPVGPAADVTASVAHVLPGGIGTYSISHVSDAGSRAVVKTEIGTCADAGSANGAFSHRGTYAGVAFTLWDQPPVVTKDAATTTTTTAGPRAQWPSPPIAVAARSSGSSFVSLSSSRNHSRQQQLRKQSMDRASGFDDDDDDEDFGGGGRRDGYPHKGEMSAKVDGKGGSILDQRPSTPRSKHSATEQRRRSKINDRFQILRELIPHSDQKRDKASFLLEVIEYIRFLQEKVQKYDESAWTEENAKLMQWSSCQSPADGIADPSLVIKNGPLTAGFAFPGSENSIPVPPPMLSAAQIPTESKVSASVSHKAENPTSFACKSGAATYPQPNLYTSLRRGTGIAQSQQPVSDSENLTSQSQTHWLRPPCPTGSTVTVDLSNEQEELAIDEGTISVSTTYSQGLLTKLSEALQNSGIDLSQANVSVQITLGKRATNRKTTATTITSRAKDHDNPCSKQVIGQSQVLSCGKEFEQASKRHKSDNS